MARDLYCWRCDRLVPMLEESEWALVQPLLSVGIAELQRYRREHGVSLADAKTRVSSAAALARYRQLTGHEETDADAIWHHRVSLHGPPCKACLRPLRTPRARYCASCGTGRS